MSSPAHLLPPITVVFPSLTRVMLHQQDLVGTHGSPLSDATALHGGLNPGQKKRVCVTGHLVFSAHPSVSPGHISGCNHWAKIMVALLQVLTLSHYAEFLNVWEVILWYYPCCPYQTKSTSSVFHMFLKFHFSLFLKVTRPRSVFLGIPLFSNVPTGSFSQAM